MGLKARPFCIYRRRMQAWLGTNEVRREAHCIRKFALVLRLPSPTEFKSLLQKTRIMNTYTQSIYIYIHNCQTRLSLKAAPHNKLEVWCVRPREITSESTSMLNIGAQTKTCTILNYVNTSAFVAEWPNPTASTCLMSNQQKQRTGQVLVTCPGHW